MLKDRATGTELFVIVFELIPAESGKAKSAQEILDQAHKNEKKVSGAVDKDEAKPQGGYVDEGVD